MRVLRVLLWMITAVLFVKAENRTFLWFSDIHLDPYYGTDLAISHNKLNDSLNCETIAETNPLGDFGCDSPPALVDSVLQHAASIDAVDFAIVTGDFVRHNNDELLPDPMVATQDILTSVSSSLLQYFPTIPIVPACGNNDVTPDYWFDLQHPDELLEMVTGGLSSLLGNKTQEFRQGAFYARTISPRLTILSLNTLIYATNHQPPSTEPDSLGQFAWLEDQLQIAAQTNSSVYLMGHIPPTVGSYRHTQLWQDQYLDRYYTLVGRYSNQVQGQLFGHIHTEEFRVHTSALFLTSSFTPIYGSNPSFRVVTYDSDTSELLDYQVHYLDLAMATTNNESNYWHVGEPFTKAFGVPDLSKESLQSIVQDLQQSTDSRHWEALLNRQHAYTHGSEVCDHTCRREWACTLSSMTSVQYNACLGVSTNPFFLMGLLVAALAIVVVAIVRRRRQRQHYQIPMELQEIDQVWDDTSGELPELS